MWFWREGVGGTLELARGHGELEVTRFCGEAVVQDSVYALLHRERDNVFPSQPRPLASPAKRPAVPRVGRVRAAPP